MRSLHLAAFVLIAVAACADSATDPVVARHMGDFFEAYLGRELTRSELGAVTDEFVRISIQEGKSLEAIHQRAAGFDRHTRILRNGRDGAAQQTARDTVIHANYFRPVMQNTIELQLFLEPDPVRVGDSRSRRLMTERDVVALVTGVVETQRCRADARAHIHSRDLACEDV